MNHQSDIWIGLGILALPNQLNKVTKCNLDIPIGHPCGKDVDKLKYSCAHKFYQIKRLCVKL